MSALNPRLLALSSPVLVDTGTWTWVRDRRFPELAEWFNSRVAAGGVLVCEQIVLELVRLTPNEPRAIEVAERLGHLDSVPMPERLWRRGKEIQLLLAAAGDHRRVPPPDLLIAAAAEQAGVTLVHYDRDYERIAAVTDLHHEWLAPNGTLRGET